MAILHITKDNFEQEVLKADKPVMVDFFATWCGPCKMLAPVLDALGDEMANVKICKSDVDEASDLAAKFGVQSIPTVVLFKNGEVVDGFVGFRAKEQIVPMLEKHL